MRIRPINVPAMSTFSLNWAIDVSNHLYLLEMIPLLLLNLPREHSVGLILCAFATLNGRVQYTTRGVGELVKDRLARS